MFRALVAFALCAKLLFRKLTFETSTFLLYECTPSNLHQAHNKNWDRQRRQMLEFIPQTIAQIYDYLQIIVPLWKTSR